jgi:hypothetical protein
MEFICKKKCYFKDRLWEVGDVLRAESQADACEHFEAKAPLILGEGAAHVAAPKPKKHHAKKDMDELLK